MSLNNLGSVLTKLGKYLQAKEELEEALTIYKAVYSDEHPYVAIGTQRDWCRIYEARRLSPS